MSVRAECPACGKSFRVPHANKTWSCKACNADLELIPDVACPACKSPNDPSASACAECGESLRENPREDVAELRRARRQIKSLNLPLILKLSLAVHLLLLVALSVHFLAGGSDGTVFFMAVIGVFFAGNLIGIFAFKRSPFRVILALAILRTLGSVVEMYVMRSGGIPFAAVPGAIYALALWTALGPARRLEDFARENPDVEAKRSARRERVRNREFGEQSIAQRGTSRARGRSQASALRLAAILVAIIGVLAAGFFAWKVTSGPSNPAETLAAFQAAWNAEDVPAVGVFFGEERAEKWTGNVRVLQEKYEWGARLPHFDGHRITERGETVMLVDFEGEGGVLGTRFRWRDGAWVVTRFDMRGVKDWRP